MLNNYKLIKNDDIFDVMKRGKIIGYMVDQINWTFVDRNQNVYQVPSGLKVNRQSLEASFEWYLKAIIPYLSK